MKTSTQTNPLCQANSENNLQQKKTMLKKTMKEMVGVRLEKELKKLLQDMADKEHRPLSNYIRFIILDWLSTHKGIDWPPKELKK